MSPRVTEIRHFPLADQEWLSLLEQTEHVAPGDPKSRVVLDGIRADVLNEASPVCGTESPA